MPLLVLVLLLPVLAALGADFTQVEAAVRGNNPCFPVSRLVTVENTHAQRGGKVLPIEFLDDLAVLAEVCICGEI